MIRNYLVATLRSFNREKLYALINICGLSLGIGCCLLLGLYINNEVGFDRHQENKESVYRIVNELVINGRGGGLAWSSRALGPLLQLDNPDVIKSYTRFKAAQPDQRSVFRHDEVSFYWDNVFLADTNVFNVFTHYIISGDPTLALEGRTSIAISESFARAYFANSDPIGEILSSDTEDYQVTLVFEDLLGTSHLKYDALISMNRLDPLPEDEASLNQELADLSLYTYVLVDDKFRQEDFVPLLARLSSERIAPLAAAFGLEDFSARFWAQNLADIHLESEVGMDEPTGNKFYVFAFTAVAVFILLIACINYVNLSTSRYFKRAREVGIRKVLGAGRQQLIGQFLGESILFVLIALILALIIVAALLDLGLLNDLFGQVLDMRVILQPGVLLSILVLGLLIGLLSGLYPAIYLSSVSPNIALAAGRMNPKHGGASLRQLLVLAQFTISIGIIACTLLMANQMNYLSSLSLGFEKENKLLVTLRGADLIESFPALKSELLRNPDILDVAIAQHVPGTDLGYFGVSVESEEGDYELQSSALMVVGNNFIKTLGISLAEGRDFSEFTPDNIGRSIIVNRAFVQQMGWLQPIGKGFRGFVSGDVVGVVENFNFDSLHQSVTPLILQAMDNSFEGVSLEGRALETQTLILNISGNKIDKNIEYLAETMNRFDPSHPLEFEFLDSRLDRLYSSEQNTMRLTAVFASICVFISCLGLFGLAAFSTEQRTKEIGIRKVFGASGLQIVWLLTRNILILVAIASFIASIISYLIMNQWLASFAYRDAVSPMMIAVATITVLFVAVSTVVLQSLKTVRANPIEALRYE